MQDMDPILKRLLMAQRHVEPERLLNDVLPSVSAILERPETIRHMSHREQSRVPEKYQAALLAFIMRNLGGERMNISVCFKEIADSDCVLKAIDPQSGPVFKLVQLKQLPPHALNPDATLQGLIKRLGTKYSRDLIVGIWINRDSKWDLRELDFSGLGFEQLYLFGVHPSGHVTIHGGVVADLKSGVCWAGSFQGGVPAIKPLRFKPEHCV